MPHEYEIEIDVGAPAGIPGKASFPNVFLSAFDKNSICSSLNRNLSFLLRFFFADRANCVDE